MNSERQYSETVPMQYEDGKAEFMGMDIMVDPRVFIPRPETELLVKTASEICKEKVLEEPFIMDLCTGSGVVSLALSHQLPASRIVATDISEAALSVARENVNVFGKTSRVHLALSDMFSEFRGAYEGKFDAIVSNPPYVSDEDYKKVDEWVKSEPRIALWSGSEGMDHLNVIAIEGIQFLKPGGFLAVEIGYDQAEKVKDKFEQSGYVDIVSYRDFNDHERVIVGYKNG